MIVRSYFGFVEKTTLNNIIEIIAKFQSSKKSFKVEQRLNFVNKYLSVGTGVVESLVSNYNYYIG